MSNGLLKWALKRTLVPWLMEQASVANKHLAANNPNRDPSPVASRPGSWRHDRSPEALAESLATVPGEAWIIRLVLKLNKPNAQTLRTAALAVLPDAYASESAFIADLAVFTYSTNADDREHAREQMGGSSGDDGL